MNVTLNVFPNPVKKVSAYSNFGWFGLACPTDAKYNIKADTKPDCDNPGPDCYWEGRHWIKLHQEKVKKYGKSEADKQWNAAWLSCRGLAGAFGHELFIAGNDAEFIQYVTAQGLINTNYDLKMIMATGKIGDAVVNTAGALADTVANTATAAASTADAAGTIAKWLPYILVGAGLIAAFIFYKMQKK